ncbi:MAG TPA: hypothetical protein H9915_03600 [Candidatus Gemmiger faecigallinarum]|nr:hypothetical protein [Candidatus Gemmiger faecigallinarum]
MKLSSIKKVVSNFLLLAEAILLFFLASAVIQGSVGLLAALGYGAGSLVAVNLLAGLLLASPRRKTAPRGRSAGRSPVPLRLLSANRHAA